jgi:hypothetical protein
MASVPAMRWGYGQSMYVMGLSTPRAVAARSLELTLRDGIAEQIRCPTLVCASEQEEFFPGQPQELFEHLTGPKTLMEFTAAEGADVHCQTGAQRLAFARVYDRLEETFRG